jgi:hypothetical protein
MMATIRARVSQAAPAAHTANKVSTQVRGGRGPASGAGALEAVEVVVTDSLLVVVFMDSMTKRVVPT